MNKSTPIRRAAAIGGAVVAIAATTLGTTAWSYLKPTAAASAPIESVVLAVPQTATGTVYQLQNAQAQFVIEEVLRGSPATVVGATDQVAGQVALDPSDANTAQLGTILIDARTLATDDSARNRALGNQILDTNQ